MAGSNELKITAQPLFGKPALLIKSGESRILAVADLHIGSEYGLMEKGVVPRSGFQGRLADIGSILDAERPGHVVLLGDVKDTLFIPGPGTSRQLVELMEELDTNSRSVVVVKGNHDGRIEELLPEEVVVTGAGGGLIEGVGFFHGHSWPKEDVMKAPLVVTAHNHQTFGSVLSGERDHHHPCWIRGGWDPARVREYYPDIDGEMLSMSEIIVVPAFVQTGKGVVVNREPIFLGPVLRKGLLDRNRSRVYLLDGTYLGKLGEFGENTEGGVLSEV